MTTQEAIYQIYERNSNASFQTCLKGNPFSSEEIYVNVAKEDPKAALGRILKMFGEQDWTELKFDGYISCYCPTAIADKLRDIKQRMFAEFAKYGCD